MKAYTAQVTCEHHTPKELVDSVNLVFNNSIDLDPASSEEANYYIQAKTIYTKDCDGYSYSWIADTVFLNPPGSQKDSVNRRSPLVWLDKLEYHYSKGDIKEAIYIGYNGPETLSKRPKVVAKSTCILTTVDASPNIECMTSSGRIKYGSFNPFFPSVILYFGNNSTKFICEFIKYGTLCQLTQYVI